MKVCACLQKLKCLCVRLQGVVCRHCYRVGKSKRSSIKISQPFDFKHVSSNPIGLDEDEINVFHEKAAASRMIPIEDQPRSNPSSVPCTPPRSPFNHHLAGHSSSSVFSSSESNSTAATASFFHNPNCIPSSYYQRPQKTRAGYRSLASSTSNNRGGGGGLSYMTLISTTESRPSITRSFADASCCGGAQEERMETQTQTSLSPASSFTTASTGSSLKYYEKRGFQIVSRPV